MKLIANQPMSYSTRRLAAGDLFTASSRDARLLIALKRARNASATPRATIPGDWQDMPWPKLRSLAAEFSDAPIKNKGDAVAAITAELTKRGTAA